MTKNYIDLSGKIDASKIELYTALNNSCREIDIPFFVAGAEARDVILEHAYGIKTTRATLDIDTAVMVNSWDEYNSVVTALKNNGFTKLENSDIRLVYKNGVLIDLIPFGQIENDNGRINWPPNFDEQFNVIGFTEAYNNSVHVKLSDNLTIKFATIAGLAMLKIFAWNDKQHGTKNAEDLLLLMQNHIDAGNNERLFEDHIDITEDEEYDYELASTRLLGRDIQPICTESIKFELIAIIDREINIQGGSRLISSMTRKIQMEYELGRDFLKALSQGLKD